MFKEGDLLIYKKDICIVEETKQYIIDKLNKLG